MANSAKLGSYESVSNPNNIVSRWDLGKEYTPVAACHHSYLRDVVCYKDALSTANICVARVSLTNMYANHTISVHPPHPPLLFSQIKPSSGLRLPHAIPKSYSSVLRRAGGERVPVSGKISRHTHIEHKEVLSHDCPPQEHSSVSRRVRN
jgi:hypothetical protein